MEDLLKTGVYKWTNLLAGMGSCNMVVFYYSGDGFSWAQPEVLLGDEAAIMCTFADQRGKEPDPRFREIHRVRLESRKKEAENVQSGRSV